MTRLRITRKWPMRLKTLQAPFATKYFLGGAILFSLLALSSALVAVNSQSGGFTVEYDTDRGGSDYRNFEVSGGYEVCRDACANDANCRAYTYTKPWQGYSAKCWLKNSVPAPVPGRDCCISGVKGGGGNVGGAGFGPRNDRAALNGTRLTYYRGTTAEQCQADCAGNPGCKGYTLIRAAAYGPNDPPMCYLMSEVTSFAPSPCCISAVKGGSEGGAPRGGGPFAGRWTAYSFGTVAIQQNGDQVTGRYTEPGGALQGVVRGNQMYFSFRHDGGGEGEAVWSLDPNNANRAGGMRCAGRGCTPDGFYDAFKQQ